jgi:hypothetical protein
MGENRGIISSEPEECCPLGRKDGSKSTTVKKKVTAPPKTARKAQRTSTDGSPNATAMGSNSNVPAKAPNLPSAAQTPFIVPR